MLVFPYFEGDNNKTLMDLQYEMYDYSISTIFEKVKQIYLENRYSVLYLSEEEKEKIKSVDNFDHRLIQKTHDILAAIFRFKMKEGLYEKELFENDKDSTKEFFDSIYRDTDFLDKLPPKYWYLTEKWFCFIVDTIRDSIPLVKELALAMLKYDRQSAWESANRAAEILINQYKDIPWKTENESEEESLTEAEQRKYKVEYSLYDYSERCQIGYGGTAYHKGYVIFYYTHLSIEDHETDRDDWDDAWHGSHTKYTITTENYTKLLLKLKNEYQESNVELESEDVKKLFILLRTNTEKTLFKLFLSVIKKNEGIMYGGKLAKLICGDKITYQRTASQYDDFLPDSDVVNYDKNEIIN
jgi:hypothetical protein